MTTLSFTMSMSQVVIRARLEQSVGLHEGDPPKQTSDKLAVCSNCGFTSSDFNKCQRCGKKLSNTVKTVAMPNFQQKSNSINVNVVKPPEESQKDSSTKTAIRSIRIKKHVKSPVIVVSSDDEETGVMGLDPKIKLNSKTSEINSLVSNVDKSPAVMGSQLGVTGNSQAIPPTNLQNSSQILSVDSKGPDGFTRLSCGRIVVGSYRPTVAPKNGITFFSDRVFIDAIPCVDSVGQQSIDLFLKDICKVWVYHDDIPSIIFYCSPACGEKVRDLLKMSSGAGGPFYDPENNDEGLRTITVYLEKSELEDNDVLAFIRHLFPSPEILKEVFNEDGSNPKPTVVTPPKLPRTILTFPNAPGGIQINSEDYACLKADAYVNDVILDFYLNYLYLNVLSEEDRERTHIFSTFFYRRLTTNREASQGPDSLLPPAKRRHNRVFKWTKKVNIFEKDFIIIPVNQDQHWYLVTICFPGLLGPVRMSDNTPVFLEPLRYKRKDTKLISIDDDLEVRDEADAEVEDLELGWLSEEAALQKNSDNTANVSNEAAKEPIKQPCILVFDSLPFTSRNRIVATLREYLGVEYKNKVGKDRVFNKDNMRASSVVVPRQNNTVDCGLFVLQYVESFFLSPINDYRLPIMTLNNWFPQELVNHKREDICQLLHRLMEENNVDIDSLDLPDLYFSVSKQNYYQPTDENCQTEEIVESEQHYTSPEEEDEELEEEEEDEEDGYEDEENGVAFHQGDQYSETLHDEHYSGPGQATQRSNPSTLLLLLVLLLPTRCKTILAVDTVACSILPLWRPPANLVQETQPAGSSERVESWDPTVHSSRITWASGGGENYIAMPEFNSYRDARRDGRNGRPQRQPC
uniref:Ubiquitin-like protease family profile domain-containing protein n=1 Tax=Timema bartmani TaxID=61472 RepID=A0A7R9EV93_9NEOP|nr:unnamed protein product [Timema bartmani]